MTEWGIQTPAGEMTFVILASIRHGRKKSSRKAWVPGGQRTRVFSGSDWFEASDRIHAAVRVRWSADESALIAPPSRADPSINGLRLYCLVQTESNDRQFAMARRENKRIVCGGQGGFRGIVASLGDNTRQIQSAQQGGPSDDDLDQHIGQRRAQALFDM